jgi:uroporphyrinogen decarboxylase
VAHGPLAAATTVAEVEAFPWPRPERWSAPDFAAARQRWPDHALMFAAGWLPLFWGACEVFGVEQALVNMLTAPAVFEACLRQEHEFCLAALRRGLPGAARHFDICLLGDDFCSQQAMLLSPADWRKFIKPLLAEQVRLARASGLRVLYHSCGAVRPVIGDLLDIGVNGLLVFQVNAAGMEAESVAREFGGKLVFYGGIDVQHLLSFGTPAEVRATVHSIARAFAGRGGYIVANAHHCVATIRGENIEAMCQAAREFKA